jgi:hypothetical protein
VGYLVHRFLAGSLALARGLTGLSLSPERAARHRSDQGKPSSREAVAECPFFPADFPAEELPSLGPRGG